MADAISQPVRRLAPPTIKSTTVVMISGGTKGIFLKLVVLIAKIRARK